MLLLEGGAAWAFTWLSNCSCRGSGAFDALRFRTPARLRHTASPTLWSTHGGFIANARAIPSVTTQHDSTSPDPAALMELGEQLPPLTSLSQRDRVFAIAAIVAGGWLAVSQAFVGWYPLDDGVLGALADLVRRGYVPHVDFVDPYSGGLSILNAAWLSTFGSSLASLRVPFLIGLAASSIGVAQVARRYLNNAVAVLFALICFVVPVLMFRIPMPTWYTTFLTVGAIHLTVTRRVPTVRALLAAGALLGVGIAIKITGLYAVSAYGAWLIAMSRWRWRAALSAVAVLSPLIVLRNVDIRMVLFFVVPIAAGAVLLWRLSRAPGVQRLESAKVIAFVGGVCLIPGLVFGMAAVAGEARTLVHAIVLNPLEVRVESVTRPAPILTLQALSLLIVLLPLFARRVDRRLGPWVMLLLPMSIAMLSLVDLKFALVAVALLHSSLVLLALRGASYDHLAPKAILAIVVASSAALVGYPFYSFAYSLYILPLVLVAAAMGGGVYRLTSSTLLTWLLPLLLTGLVQFSAGRTDGNAPKPARIEYVDLASERANLVVPTWFEPWNGVLGLAEAQARYGLIWAGPESPEIYFLTGQTSPLLHTYEFLLENEVFVPGFAARLADLGVCTVIINRTGISVSEPPAGETLHELRTLYPNELSRAPFEIRSRDEEGCDGATK